jgi:uncharacterized tellurite resistance protein B-like protein
MEIKMDSSSGSTIGVLFGEVSSAKDDVDFDEIMANAKVPGNYGWSIEEAYMCSLLDAVWADDDAAPEEKAYLSALVKRCQTLRGKGDNELARLNMTVMEKRQNQPNYLANACEALPSDMHRTLFAHAIDIVMADGRLHPAEESFLEDLMDRMRFEPSEVRRIMEVMLDKNRF